MKRGVAILAVISILSILSVGYAQSSSEAPAQQTSARNKNANNANALHDPENDMWTKRSLTARGKDIQLLIGPTSRQALSLYPTMEFGLDVHRLHKGDIHEIGKRNVGVYVPIGIAYGITDNLEIGTAVPFQVKPGDMHNIPLWLTYGFLDGPFQMGAQFALSLPLNAPIEVQLGLPMQLSTGILRLDTGFYTVFSFTERVTTTLRVPLRFGFQATQNVYAGIQTEVAVGIQKRADDSRRTTATMPLYGFLGYTVDGLHGPIDIAVRFGFDRLVSGGGGFGADVSAEEFSFAIGANLIFEL